MNFGKLGALWGVFKKGEEVTNPERWKDVTAAGTAIAGLILAGTAAAKAFGYDLPEVTDTQALLWGSGLASVVLWVNSAVHLVTSKRVGVGGNATSSEVTKPKANVADPSDSAGV